MHIPDWIQTAINNGTATVRGVNSVAFGPTPVEAPKPKKSKYLSRWVEVDGEKFQSEFEANHWIKLRLMQQTGEISDLKRQRPFPLVVNGVLIYTYKADFVYIENGKQVVVDTKSAQTAKLASYRIAKKLMLALHGIEIVEVVKPGWKKRKQSA